MRRSVNFSSYRIIYQKETETKKYEFSPPPFLYKNEPLIFNSFLSSGINKFILSNEETNNIPYLVQFLYFVVIDLYVLCVISSLRDASRWKFVKTVRIRDNSKKETLVICKVEFYKSHTIPFQRGSHEKNCIFHYPGIITF